MNQQLRNRALYYHRMPTPGKLRVQPSKPLTSQADLALAYSPGVAEPCREIAADPSRAAWYTARANLIAVVSNGSAVLGLGNIGPLAAKPVMEGKAVLFKRFADIDVFDLEIDESDPERLVDIIASLEPTFGGINLEDIKAPDCFLVERKLAERLRIPVFHDDQHGTAIIVAAALRNALRLVGKEIGELRLVACGAGAAGIACLDMLCEIGLQPGHVRLFDQQGVVHQGRSDIIPQSARYASADAELTMTAALQQADVFLGLSAGGVLQPDMLRGMAADPIIFALANPDPEIAPEQARAVRDDAILATGRSDYPNQVNNVLCFPYIFRGALDVGASCFNREMKIACIEAIADLASKAGSADEEESEGAGFGRDYLIPRPFDARLVVTIPLAVAKAAMASGVASQPIADFTEYRERLERFRFASSMVMKPVIEQSRRNQRRVLYSDGEDLRVLRALQSVVGEQLAYPVLIGRPAVIAQKLKSARLPFQIGRELDVIDPADNVFHKALVEDYHHVMERHGVRPEVAAQRMRVNPVVLASMLLRQGHGDALLAGVRGDRAHRLLQQIVRLIGLRPGLPYTAAMNGLIIPEGMLFFCDSFVNINPDAKTLCGAAELAVEQLEKFGIVPRAALLSHSNFGSSYDTGSAKMAQTLQHIRQRLPTLDIEGEMNADVALSPLLRQRIFPRSRLQERANLLLFPSLDAAQISYSLLKQQGQYVSIGPILMGLQKPVHILTPSATVRGIFNMTAVAASDSFVETAVAG